MNFTKRKNMSQRFIKVKRFFAAILALAIAALCVALSDNDAQAQSLPPGYGTSGGTIDTLEDGRIVLTLRPGDNVYRKVNPGKLIFPKLIVADCRYRGKLGMWLLDSLGDTLQQISSRAGSASWSSDQRRFVCVSPRYQLKVLALDEPGRGVVVNLPSNMNPGRPAWSPIEDLVAFIAKDKNDLTQIYLVKPDSAGSGLKQLTYSGQPIGGPTWRPDGKLITFSIIGAGLEGIYSISPEGSEIQTLYKSDSIPLVDAVWSPNSKYLLAVNPPSGNIFRINSDGSNPVNMTKMGQTQFPFIVPRFTEEGKFFLCTGKRPGSKGPEIYRVPIDGGLVQRITDPLDEIFVITAVANR